jgi:hypothetical protein
VPRSRGPPLNERELADLEACEGGDAVAQVGERVVGLLHELLVALELQHLLRHDHLTEGRVVSWAGRGVLSVGRGGAGRWGRAAVLLTAMPPTAAKKTPSDKITASACGSLPRQNMSSLCGGGGGAQPRP